MLEKVRKPGRAKSFMAYFIFGAICLVFVFFGVGTGSFSGITGGSGAAVVNSTVISIGDYRRYYDQLSRQFQSQLNGLPSALRQEKLQDLRESAINQLINLEVIAQSAQASGVYVADGQVRDTIVGIQAFQEDGRFQRQNYDNYLTYSRLSPAEFEGQIRKELAMNRMRGLFGKSLRALSDESNKDHLARETKLNLSFVGFDKGQLEKKLKVTDEEKTQFLSAEESRTKIEEDYKSNQALYTSEPEVKARHILLKVDAKKGVEAEAKVKEKIEEIRKELTPKNFGELAKKYSEGPTKTKEGDLGWFNKKAMVKPFADVAFSLPKGQISGPVKTNFGYHLIFVEDKKEGGVQELAKVESEIAEKMIRKEKMEKVFGRLEEAVKGKSSKDIDKIVSEQGLKWEQTGEFDLSREQPPKLGSNGDGIVAKILSAPEVGQVVPELLTSGGRYYVVKLDQLKRPAKSTADDLLEADFLSSRRANEAFSNWQEKARETAKITTNSQVLGR